MNESTIDMMNLDRRLETLAFQIFAYQRAKEIDHQPLMEFNLYAIKTLCIDIYYKLEAEERREAEVKQDDNQRIRKEKANM